ncbi:hypothetical protein [Limnochorda pilosa]|uniref:Uncharacterized protein n=1 Tax=Limnochorda pilosa TaxID=1555112 RepID=A0A0K2SJ79_LIMPI|nr:hypothetical protein [Limnochorda pilosa]BAS27092.1 hypothetical protein LIP_1235 [Limnochorda pilosa]
MRFTVKGTTYVDSEHRSGRKGGLKGRIRLVTGNQELVLNLSSLRAAERLIDHLWSAAYGPEEDPATLSDEALSQQSLPF